MCCNHNIFYVFLGVFFGVVLQRWRTVKCPKRKVVTPELRSPVWPWPALRVGLSVRRPARMQRTSMSEANALLAKFDFRWPRVAPFLQALRALPSRIGRPGYVCYCQRTRRAKPTAKADCTDMMGLDGSCHKLTITAAESSLKRSERP